MKLRSLVLALVLASGMATAAGKHPKPPKVSKHATAAPVAGRHSKSKAVKHQGQKVAKHRTSSPKIAKHKTAKVKRHKA